MKFETTHQLAQYLLSKDDCPVRHHFYYHQNFNEFFNEYGEDLVSKVYIVEKGGKVYISVDDYLEEEF